MNRRKFATLSGYSLATVLWLAHAKAYALSLGDLSNADASQGLKTALEKGAIAAVNLLGKTDGFLGNEKVRIPLPGFLDSLIGGGLASPNSIHEAVLCRRARVRSS